MIRKAGIEPTIIEYLKTPPTRDELVALIDTMPITARELLRKKGTPYHDLGLDDPDLTDDQLIDAMMEHPILINRPIVISDQEANLCRPSEKVMALLPTDIGSFTKEDGEVVTSDKDQAG